MFYKPTYNWGGTTLYELPKQCWAVFKSRNAVPLYWLLNRISEFSHHDHLTFIYFYDVYTKNERNRNQRNKQQGSFILKTKFIINQQGSSAADLEKVHLQPGFQAATSLESPLRCNDAGSIVCGFHHDPRLLRGHDHVLILWGCEGDPDEEKEGRKKDLRMGYGDGAKLFVPDIYIYIIYYIYIIIYIYCDILIYAYKYIRIMNKWVYVIGYTWNVQDDAPNLWRRYVKKHLAKVVWRNKKDVSHQKNMLQNKWNFSQKKSGNCNIL